MGGREPSGGNSSGWEENHRLLLLKVSIEQGSDLCQCSLVHVWGKSGFMIIFLESHKSKWWGSVFWGRSSKTAEIKWVIQVRKHNLKTKLFWQKHFLFLIYHFHLSSTLWIVRIGSFYFTSTPGPFSSPPHVCMLSPSSVSIPLNLLFHFSHSLLFYTSSHAVSG